MSNGKKTGQILLVSSLTDPAGTLIHEEIKRILLETPQIQVRYQHQQFSERLIYLDGPSLTTTADLIVFLSRHASKEPRKVLTVHVTGNFGPAEYGGDPATLTPAATVMMHAIMNRLAAEVPEEYSVTYEATHHGPTLVPVPSCFVEVGSTEREWHDRVAAAAVARAVIGAVPEAVIPMVGYGGTHYAKRQTEITLTTRGGFGHIMPTRDLIHLDQTLFDAMITASDAEAIYIDRKSVSREELHRIEEFASRKGIPVLGQTDLNNLTNLNLKDYLTIRMLAEEILPGSTITIHDIQSGENLTTISVPPELIAEAAKCDPDRLLAMLDSLPVVRLSGKGIAFYSTFITSRENVLHITNELIHFCVSILHRNCSCRFDGDCLIITREKFDPEIAISLGIVPGPEFGRLMAGEMVVSQGREVTPAMVMKVTEKRICIPGWGT